MATQPVDLDRLRKAIRGGDPEIARGEAFALLTASPFAEREKLLGSVLQDRSERPASRSAAAIALGQIATRDSEQILLANLSAGEPTIQAEVLRALGRIGGREALAGIDALRLPAQAPRKATAEFGAALIAHRLRLEGHDLPLPSEDRLLKTPSEQSQPMRVSTLRSEDAAKVVDDLKRYPHGIEYDQGRLVRLECGKRVNVVCPNREFTESSAVARLAQQKALVGVVALRSPETGDYSVSYLLMVAPGGPSTRLKIIAPRCSGRPGLAGTGELAGDRMVFHLRTVERPGAFPMEVSGEFVAGEIRFRRAVISLDQVPSRTPALRR
jgi:HEAT repeats